MLSLTMLKGLPASWKSKWAKEEVSKNPNGIIRINNDDLRSMMNGGYLNRNMECVVENIRYEAIDKALYKWLHVIVDNTNLSPILEEKYREIAKERKAQFIIKEFIDDVEVCIERDRKRESSVGEKVIRDMSEKYNWWKVEPKFAPIIQDNYLPKVFIFDIDGTVARMNGRSPYDYSRVEEDLPIENVVSLFNILAKDNDIIFVSGRETSCVIPTCKWLEDNGMSSYIGIRMRKEGDRRSDDIVKREIAESIAQDYYIAWVFDDRDRVVKMWRESWIQCYQCNYWPF